MSSNQFSNEEKENNNGNRKSPKRTSKKTCEIGTNCDLFSEYTEADEKLFSRADLTEEQLKLKEQDPTAFWKSVNENLRINLQDALADNEEVL